MGESFGVKADNAKTVLFNGIVFVRDDDTGYYRGYKRGEQVPTLLHRYVVQMSGREIPEGCEVHHKDCDRSNNLLSNLQVLRADDHKRLHAALLSHEERERRRANMIENAQPAAAEWHKTEEGRQKSREVYEQFGKFNLHEKFDFVCEQCGKPFIAEKGARFCSNKCKAAHRRAIGADNETRICKECGKTFTVNRYKKTEFCSGTCASTYNGKIRHDKYVKGLADGTIQSPVVEAVCPICGETFTKKRWESKKVCSPECRIKYTAQKQTGRSNVITKTFRHVCEVCGCEYENHSAHSTVCSTRCKQRKAAAKGRGMVEAVCVVCGAKFMHTKYNNSQTCSRKCRMVLIAKNYLGKAGVKVGDLKSASAPVGNSSQSEFDFG